MHIHYNILHVSGDEVSKRGILKSRGSALLTYTWIPLTIMQPGTYFVPSLHTLHMPTIFLNEMSSENNWQHVQHLWNTIRLWFIQGDSWTGAGIVGFSCLGLKATTSCKPEISIKVRIISEGLSRFRAWQHYTYTGTYSDLVYTLNLFANNNFFCVVQSQK
jgi:hypothetical protein